MEIGNQTNLTGVIGFPISHTLSPAIFNTAYERLGLDWCYVPLEVSKPDLDCALAGLAAVGFKGINVTMPHKENVLSLLDELDESAFMTGAVNTVHFEGGRSFGYNTDGQGLINALRDELSFSPSGKKVLILGAGGAARAVAISVALAGADELIVVNRTYERALSLEETVKRNISHCKITAISSDSEVKSLFERADLIINATSVGMGDQADQAPCDTELIKQKHYVFDLIYEPAETLLLKEARRNGAKASNGLKMLVYQAAAGLKIWTGLEMPIEEVVQVLKQRRGPDQKQTEVA